MRNGSLRANPIVYLAAVLVIDWTGTSATSVHAEPPAPAVEPAVKPAAKPAVAPPSRTEHLVAAAQVQSFENAASMASQMARRPMRPLVKSPAALAQLTYDQYMTIRYKPGRAIWQRSASPVLLETFHQGFVQQDQIDLFIQTPDGNRWIAFDPNRFDYRALQSPDTKQLSDELAAAIESAGHAGIKLIDRFDRDDLQELITFLGASYFRARSRDTFYGTSARGLAVDIALPTEEEFPRFRTFWVRRPFPGDKTIAVTALLDSPACTGAYEFTIAPGDHRTTVDVRAEVFPRQGQQDRKFAFAPLTSMWLWGDGLRGPSLDERPHVHDSSALVIQASTGPPIFRPLARISYPSVSRYPVDSLVGFGLVQRNRDPDQYNDENAKYHRRPTVLITPAEPWRGGVIELFEIPGAHEGVDNIGAYWLPPEMPGPDESISLRYRIDFTSADADWSGQKTFPLARIASIDIDRAATGSPTPDAITMTAHLRGDHLANLNESKIVQQIATVRGEVIGQTIVRTGADAIDASVTIRPTENAPTEITVGYQSEGQSVAETLSYLCPPTEPKFVFPAVYTRVE